MKIFNLFVLSFLFVNIAIAQVTPTNVQAGLAIETGGINDLYKEKKAVLYDIMSSTEGDPIWWDYLFTGFTSKYKATSLLEAKKVFGPMVLEYIHNYIFAKSNIQFTDEDVFTLSDALISNNGKFTFDCDASSFVYIEALESKFTTSNMPVVILDCPEYKDYVSGHTLIRWKYDDVNYLDWETEKGVPASTDDTNGRYKNNCREITVDSNTFLALFHINRGNKELSLEKHSEATTDYDKAIKLDPDAITAYENRGTIKALSGGTVNLKAAILDYSNAIDASVRLKLKISERVYLNRGSAKKELGLYKQALADYDIVINANLGSKAPYVANAYYNRGFVKKMLKEPVGAKKDYDEAVKRDASIKDNLDDYTK